MVGLMRIIVYAYSINIYTYAYNIYILGAVGVLVLGSGAGFDVLSCELIWI